MRSSSRIGRRLRVLATLLALAIVVGAGIFVGQAPAIFGAEVDEEPDASIEFEDQQGNGSVVQVASVELSDGGFVVVTDAAGTVVGVSEPLDAGEHERVTVEAREDGDSELLGQLTATAYLDATGDEEFVPPPDRDDADGSAADGEEATDDGDEESFDRPYLEDGHPVGATATVTAAEDRDDEPSASFQVESIDGPANGTTADTIAVVASVSNPADDELRQHVELRVDGELRERRVLSLEGGETRELEFELPLDDVGSGTYVYGVYTAEDGAHAEIDVAYAGPPALAVADANASTATVDVALPDGGFVVIENATGEVVSTGESLAVGAHENVSVSLPADAANESLTAVAVRGEPDDAEPEAYAVDGERVEAAVQTED